MNFIHQGSLSLARHRLFRVTLDQVLVQDPSIGCGTYFNLLNDWQLRKALFHHADATALFEVRRVHGVAAEDPGQFVAAKNQETFIVFVLAEYQVSSTIRS